MTKTCDQTRCVCVCVFFTFTDRALNNTQYYTVYAVANPVQVLHTLVCDMMLDRKRSEEHVQYYKVLQREHEKRKTRQKGKNKKNKCQKGIGNRKDAKTRKEPMNITDPWP